MKANHRIEILGIDNSPLLGSDVRELREVFLVGNVIRYKVVSIEKAIDAKRIEMGTPQLNFVFNTENRSISDEVEFLKTRLRELQKNSPNWFDKRTHEYKYSRSFANGFNTPLIFEEA